MLTIWERLDSGDGPLEVYDRGCKYITQINSIGPRLYLNRRRQGISRISYHRGGYLPHTWVPTSLDRSPEI